MARNRKSQSAAIRFGPALKAFLLCLLIGGSGVGYVWQKEQIAKLGHQLKSRETRLNSLEQQNELLRKQLANMHSPRFLELRIKETNLGLVAPQLSQIMRLSEPVAEPPRADHQPQYAAQTEHPVIAP
jgi:uncharacterized protein HemX